MTEMVLSGSIAGSNTTENRGELIPQERKPRSKGKPFEKGDSRINRHGRPKSFDTLRKMMVRMLNEELASRDGSVRTTHLELILRNWMQSNNFQKQNRAIEIAYGKIPDLITIRFDPDALTDEQLERLAKGEDIISVLTKPRKNG